MKFKGREIIIEKHSEYVSRQDNMGCGLSNPRLSEYIEYRLKNGTKLFYELKDIKDHIINLNKKKRVRSKKKKLEG